MTRILYEKNGFEFQVFESDLYINDRLVRKCYSYHFSDIKNTAQLLATIRAGAFCFPGGYTIVFLTVDCEVIHFDCVKKDIRQALYNIRFNMHDKIVSAFINYEDTDLCCIECSEKIKSEYCEN